MKHSSTSARGFTIVELLIVIVVIGILTSVTVVAYRGIQGRARDSQRLSDLKTIMKALEIYKINNGVYPNSVMNPIAGNWEVSTDGTDGDKLHFGHSIPKRRVAHTG